MRFRSILLALLGGNLLITAANLLRDISFAAYLGATRESDILFLAISIPVFLLTVATNAFRSVAVPALGKAPALPTGGRHDWSRRLVSVGATTTLAVSACLAVLASLLYVVDVPAVSESSRQLLSLVLLAILPMYAFTAMVELIQGPMQVSGQFLRPALLRVGLPIGATVGAIALHQYSVFGVAMGGAIGALVALIGGAALLRSRDLLPVTRTLPLPSDVSRNLRASYLALVAATCITYANPLVDQWIAGLAGEGGISMLGYANRLTTGIAALVSASLSQALLVRFGAQVGAEDFAGVRDTYRRVILVAPWVGCFATLSLWLTSDFAISLLYQRGDFTAETSGRVSTLVDIYALQLPIFWTGVASFTLIWALSRNSVFLRIGVVLLALNIVCGLTFVHFFGLNGIPLSTSVVYLVSVVLLNVALRDAVRLRLRDLWAILVPFGILLLCGLVVRALNLRLDPSESLGTLSSATLLLIVFGGIGTWVTYRVWRAPAREARDQLFS